MKFTLKQHLPISDLTPDEMAQYSQLGVKEIHSKLTPEEASIMAAFRMKHYIFDRYEYDNFDFIFFFEKSKKGVGHLETTIFYGNVESGDFTRENYNNWKYKSWWNDDAFEKWHEAIEPIVRQAWKFAKIKDKYIFDPNRSNIKARNTTWSKTLSVLPTLDPNFEL